MGDFIWADLRENDLRPNSKYRKATHL